MSRQVCENSFEIEEPQNRMTFTSSSADHSVIRASQDLQIDLDYSRDEASFSFHIENIVDKPRNSLKASTELQKFPIANQITINSHINNKQQLPNKILINEPPKRFRKDIFEKYKSPVETAESKHNQNSIMKTFDSIFTINSARQITIDKEPPQKQPILLSQPKRSSHRPPIITQILSQSIEIATPTNKAKEIKQVIQNKINPLLESTEFFKTPLDFSIQKKKPHNNSPLIKESEEQSIHNLSQIEGMISMIGQQNQADISRDSTDFQQILSSEIFKNSTSKYQQEILKDRAKLFHKPTNIEKQKYFPLIDLGIKAPLSLNLNIEKTIKNGNINQPQSPFQLQDIMKSEQQILSPPRDILPLFLPAFQKPQQDQSLKQSRFSDVYQRIDVSNINSLPSSVITHHKIFGNPTGSLKNMLSGNQYVSNKSESFGKIFYNNDTMINSLGSQKVIPQASQQQKYPIFMRKSAKLNSVYPNMSHSGFNPQNQNTKLNELIQCFSDSLSFLQKVLQKIRQKQKMKSQMTKLIESSGNIKLVQFMRWNFKKFVQFQHIQLLKVRDRMGVRDWSDSKVEKAMSNYRKIIQNHRGIAINMKDERGQQKYGQIRKKYWDIQKNMILISEDMYHKITKLAYPSHYIWYQQIIKVHNPPISYRQATNYKNMLAKCLQLRANHDQLTLSQVGQTVINKLNHFIKFIWAPS